MVCLPFNLNPIKLNPNKTMELCQREKKTLPLLLWWMWWSIQVISSFQLSYSCLEKDCGFSLNMISRELRMCGWFYKDYFFFASSLQSFQKQSLEFALQNIMSLRVNQSLTTELEGHVLCVSVQLWQDTWYQQLREEQLFGVLVSGVQSMDVLLLLLGGTSKSDKCVMGLLSWQEAERSEALGEPKLHFEFSLLCCRDPWNKNASDLQALCPRTDGSWTFLLEVFICRR